MPLELVQQRAREQTIGVFRIEEGTPFQPFGWQARGPLGRLPARPYATGASGYDDEEQRPLFAKDYRASDMSASITLCAAVSLWILLISLIGVMYVSFSSSVAAMREATKPYMMEAINHTMSVLTHLDQSSISANDVVDGARVVTNQAVPALQTALNQTSAMITRLEALARHPVLQLSLAQGTAGGL